jgi:hypothetical protein
MNSWSWTLLEKPPIVQILKKFSAFYGIRRFITVLTRALHWSLSGATTIHSIPLHPICLRSNLVLSTHLCLDLPSGLFLSGFHINTLYALIFSPIRATCPAHLVLLDLIIIIILGEEYKLWSSSLCSFLKLSLCFSLNVRDQVSHPYRTTGKIIVLYIPTLMFLDSRREDKRFWTEW